MKMLLRFILLVAAGVFVLRMFKKLLSGGDTLSQPVTPRTVNPPNQDPYAVLGVSRGASKDEIKAAYRRAISQYHPDKVAHLGAELQRVAKQKTEEIMRAYALLVGEPA